jgi:hypothetical protein
MDAETPARQPPSLRRSMLVFAGAVLAPVVIGAAITGLVLFNSAGRTDDLAEGARGHRGPSC